MYQAEDLVYHLQLRGHCDHIPILRGQPPLINEHDKSLELATLCYEIDAFVDWATADVVYK